MALHGVADWIAGGQGSAWGCSLCRQRMCARRDSCPSFRSTQLPPSVRGGP